MSLSYPSISLCFSPRPITISDLGNIEGRRYPARRRTQNQVGGAAPIQARNFAIGHVTLEPKGGQVPWHNQEQEEVYFIIEGPVMDGRLQDAEVEGSILE